MNICINYFGKISSVVKRAKESVRLNKVSTVSELLYGDLCARHKELRDYLPDYDRKTNASIVVFVNGQKVDCCDDRLLSDGDEITIMTPIAGG